MVALVKVLIGSLARLLRGLAEMLGRWAAPAPQPLPAWSPTPAPGAPEDWVRRAVPPPPAHWLAVVRARAPQFQLLDPRAPRAPQPAPSFSPLLRPKDAPIAVPTLRAPKMEAPPLPTPPRPILGAPKAASVTPRRVVTIVEEQSPRSVRRQDESILTSFRKNAPTPAPEPSPSLRRAAGAPWPSLQLVPPIAPPEPETATPRPPAFATDAAPLRADEPSLEALNCQSVGDKSKKSIYGLLSDNSAAPATPAVPALSEPTISWPSLPDARQERPEDVCRALLREARIDEELAREQRGAAVERVAFLLESSGERSGR
jgi:hypothetical protein